MSEISKDERTWAMACHLSALTGFFTGGLGAIVGPLLVWLLKKEGMPFVDEQGKESLNFQITMLIASLISGILVLLLVGILLLIAVFIIDVVFVIIASVKANDGEHYRYPINLRLIK